MAPSPENLQAMRIYSRQLLSFDSGKVLKAARSIFSEDGTVDCSHANLAALAEAMDYMEFWGAE